MKKLFVLLVLALALPTAAFAKGGPKNGTHPNHGHQAKVMYVLKGTIYDYTAYNSDTSTDGSIMIDVGHSNRHGKLLVGQTLTIDIGAKTKVRLMHGVTAIAADAASGDRGMIKVRASKLAFKTATQTQVEDALQGQPAHMVFDRGPAPTS